MGIDLSKLKFEVQPLKTNSGGGNATQSISNEKVESNIFADSKTELKEVSATDVTKGINTDGLTEDQINDIEAQVAQMIKENKQEELNYVVDEHDTYIDAKMGDWTKENPFPMSGSQDEIDAWIAKRDEYKADLEDKYEKHNPEYAAAKEKYKELSEPFQKEMDEMSAAYDLEHPRPKSPEGMEKWKAEKDKYMEGVQDSYIKNNPEFGMYHEAFNQKENQSLFDKLKDLMPKFPIFKIKVPKEDDPVIINLPNILSNNNNNGKITLPNILGNENENPIQKLPNFITEENINKLEIKNFLFE